MRTFKDRLTTVAASVALIVSNAGMALPFILTQKAAATNDDKIWICHAPNSDNFEALYVDLNGAKNGHGAGNGAHSDDIVPSFGDFPGLNWTTEGQAYWSENCDNGGEVLSCNTNRNTSTQENECEEPVCTVESASLFTTTGNQGKRKNGSNVLAARSDTDSIGATSGGPFYALGFGGSVTVEFTGYILDNPIGTELTLFEVTNPPYGTETVNIEVSQDGLSWGTPLNTATNNAGTGGASAIDTSATGLPWFKYVKVTDTSNPNIFPADADGFDLDAIVASAVCELPEEDPQVQACEVTTSVLTTDLETWDFSETRSAGHYELVDSGLRIWTDTDVAGSPDPRKTAGYYETNFLLSGLGDQTIAESLDYEAIAGTIAPGLQLVTDFDGNGTADGILVGEAIYGNDWWATNSTVLPSPGTAPQTGGGFGSNRHGTINEWLALYPDAKVKAIGYSLGSGVNGDGIIRRISLGCADYTFDLPPAKTATLVAHKIVCDDESDLPNDGFSSITATTHTDWLNDVGANKGCVLAEDWSFEYSTSGDQGNPGDSLYGSKGSPWQTFTAVGETASTQVPVDGVSLIQAREVLQEGYIPFNGPEGFSAEFYCANDAANYDNWEWIPNPSANTTYYCVAFNVPEESTFTLSASKVICDNESGLPNWGDGIDEVNIDATTALKYVEDSEGKCSLSEWDFQWSQDGVSNPGDNEGEQETDWTTFQSGGHTLSVSEVGQKFWIREVADPNYIPFSGWNTTEDISAEFYCNGDVLNYDNWEFIESPQAGATYHCIAFNVPNPTLAAVVTVCKVDAVGNALSGWTLMLLGDKVEDIDIPVTTPAGTNTATTLSASKSYVAIAEGTWENRRSPLNLVDAEYSTEDTWATHMDGFTGFSTDILELQINEAFDPSSDWGAYNSAHRYAQGFTIPADGTANFRIYDGNPVPMVEASWYADNSGELSVALYEGYAGITGENGCVTFEDVPYGTYMVDEIMQDGWENESGLGEVEIDEDTTLEVANSLIPETEESNNGRVAGNVFSDDNGNSNQDEGEVNLKNWTVWLLTHNSPWKLQAATTTNDGGEYAFEDLAVPGTYYVCQDVQQDWFQTLLNEAGLDGLDASSFSVGDIIGDSPELDALIAQFCYKVDLTTEAPEALNRDFGNRFDGQGLVEGACDLDNDGISDENCEEEEATTDPGDGQVLAATDGLSNTGSPVVLYAIASAIILGIALWVSQRKVRN